MPASCTATWFRQSVRTETLGKFKNGDIQMLVCSDVAARGLDISELSHVFNFDVPTTADDYVHRIGRTGRAGRSGRAFTLATPEDRKFVLAINKLLGAPISPLAMEDEASPEPAAKETAPKAEAEAAAPKRRRGSRRSGPAEEPKRRPPKRERSSSGRGGKRGGKSETHDEAVVGLGDHTPAFLLRPVRRVAANS